MPGYRALEGAVLVQLFVGQFFAFIDHSFVAVWAFLACVAMLVTLRFMIQQELRHVQERMGGMSLAEPAHRADPTISASAATSS